ncbi:MAG: pyridoxal-phosphate dependent enzyme [Paracoccaceae bacterium]
MDANIEHLIKGLTLDAMREQHRQLRPHVVATPSIGLDTPRLAPLLAGGALFLKLENVQKTGTFKARGALSVALAIPQARRVAGITAASAGNHAIAAAWAARHIGVSAKVVMMATANAYRVARARDFGAEVIMIEGPAEAMARAEQLAGDEGRTYIHPFEGPLTTLGAAGVGLELCEQVAGLDAVVVSVGGGGLVSGVAAAVKQLRPGCKVYGVEPEGACTMRLSLDAGRPVAIERVTTLADSLGAPSAMPFSFGVCQRFVDKVVTVSDDEICAGVVLYQEEAKLAVEPAAGAALAAALGPLRRDLAGLRTGIVVCGSNIDAASYRKVLQRGEACVGALIS